MNDFADTQEVELSSSGSIHDQASGFEACKDKKRTPSRHGSPQEDHFEVIISRGEEMGSSGDKEPICST